MTKKIFNVLLLPFKYLYIAIKVIVLSIAKGLVFVLKTIINVLTYSFLYLYKGIALLIRCIVLVFKWLFTNLYRGIYFIIKYLYLGIYSFIRYILLGIIWVIKHLYKFLLSFFIYMLLGIKFIIVLIFKIIVQLIRYFYYGVAAISIGIEKSLIFILSGIKKFLMFIYNELKKLAKKLSNVLFVVPMRLYREWKEKRRIELEKKRKEAAEKREKLRQEIEARRAERNKQLEEKRAKEEKARKEKAEANFQRREKLRREVEARKAERNKKFAEIRENKKRISIEKRAKEEKIRKEKEETNSQKREKDEIIRKAQAESRIKTRLERKPFNDKLKEWYNNLSFIKYGKNRSEMKRQTLLINFEGEEAERSDEKVLYKYVAKNTETGKIEKGEFAAFSKLDVHSYLLSEGYEVYEITPLKTIGKNFKGGTFLTTKIKKSDLVFFLTQLSTFLKSGVTLVDSVKILSKQTRRRTYRQLYKSIIYELTMGENFSEALTKQGEAFPRLLVNMIKTSELTGNLPETLDDMAGYYEETEKTRKQMVSAMTYPIVIFLFAIIIVGFIMIYVIPQFVDIYAGLNTKLPSITVFVINASHFLQKNVIFLILGAIAFVFGFRALYKSIKVFRTLLQWTMMHLPVMGKIIIYNEVTMFTKTFGSLLNHNVFITDSMEVLSKITNNEVYKMLIFDTITNLAKGEPISNSFKNHWAFPIVAYEMLLTGEKTGQLGDMMNKVSNYYQEQHKNAVNQIKVFIEPVMIVFLAFVVGTILLSVILPMFSMYSAIS